ncbi:MAG: Gfo/Idh/MocA family oxidoreductase [Eubacteriales bacterium]|nr:Gfo/Idh/MocA family oxidoreductase [Eubacteriales bacterium]MDY5015041.1 Gfo/Idh/MocA family oxidoreductase [Eubacteriales bacterium]
MHRFAVIGSNFVTDWLIEASREVENVELAAVYSRTEARGQEYAARHGIPRVYTSLDALAADPDIDFVYIASPNLCHAPQAIRLLDAGKHVLCEKPIAPDLASFDAMRDAAQKNGRVLMEAMVCAHLPCWLSIRETLAEIAPIRRASLSFCQYSSRYDKFKAGVVENAFNPKLCNGALMDLGVYTLAAAQMIFGAPDAVRASMLRLPDSIDGAGSVTLTYAHDDPLTQGGAIADIQYSKISQGTNPCEIQGERGSLLIDSITRPKAWRLLPRDGRRSDGVRVEAAGGGPRTLDVTPARHPMAYELAEFVRQLDCGADARWLDASRAVVAVMDEARRQTGLTF